jgi:hypothetical protein
MGHVLRILYENEQSREAGEMVLPSGTRGANWCIPRRDYGGPYRDRLYILTLAKISVGQVAPST